MKIEVDKVQVGDYVEMWGDDYTINWGERQPNPNPDPNNLYEKVRFKIIEIDGSQIRFLIDGKYVDKNWVDRAARTRPTYMIYKSDCKNYFRLQPCPYCL